MKWQKCKADTQPCVLIIFDDFSKGSQTDREADAEVFH